MAPQVPGAGPTACAVFQPPACGHSGPGPGQAPSLLRAQHSLSSRRAPPAGVLLPVGQDRGRWAGMGGPSVGGQSQRGAKARALGTETRSSDCTLVFPWVREELRGLCRGRASWPRGSHRQWVPRGVRTEPGHSGAGGRGVFPGTRPQSPSWAASLGSQVHRRGRHQTLHVAAVSKTPPSPQPSVPPGPFWQLPWGRPPQSSGWASVRWLAPSPPKCPACVQKRQWPEPPGGGTCLWGSPGDLGARWPGGAGATGHCLSGWGDPNHEGSVGVLGLMGP